MPSEERGGVQIKYWTEMNKMMYNRDKCKVWHSRQNKDAGIKWKDTWLCIITCEWDLGVAVDHKMNMRHQSDVAAKMANAILA